MISVFDTNPIIFESDDRTLTISYNGVYFVKMQMGRL